jgi:hypothetical protein
MVAATRLVCGLPAEVSPPAVQGVRERLELTGLRVDVAESPADQLSVDRHQPTCRTVVDSLFC